MGKKAFLQNFIDKSCSTWMVCNNGQPKKKPHTSRTGIYKQLVSSGQGWLYVPAFLTRWIKEKERKGRKTLRTEWISAIVPLSLVLMLVEVCLTFSFLSLPTPFLSSGLVWTGCEREREEANTQSNTKNARHGINKFAHNSGPRTSRNRSHIAIIFFFPLQTIIELRMIFGLQVRWGRQISNSLALLSFTIKTVHVCPFIECSTLFGSQPTGLKLSSFQCSLVVNPFTPKSYLFRITPAAPPKY